MRSGSLFGSSIEPDVSIRKTRFACGRSAIAMSKPLMPMWTSFVSGIPRRRHHRHRRLERLLGRVRARIVVGEVVDQLLDAHRIVLRQHAVVERRAHERIGRRVDVDREGGDRLLRRHLQRIGLDRLELVAALVVIAGLRHRLGRDHRTRPMRRARRPSAPRRTARPRRTCRRAADRQATPWPVRRRALGRGQRRSRRLVHLRRRRRSSGGDRLSGATASRASLASLSCPSTFASVVAGASCRLAAARPACRASAVDGWTGGTPIGSRVSRQPKPSMVWRFAAVITASVSTARLTPPASACRMEIWVMGRFPVRISLAA